MLSAYYILNCDPNMNVQPQPTLMTKWSRSLLKSLPKVVFAVHLPPIEIQFLLKKLHRGSNRD